MSRWRRHLQAEDGIALVTALLAVIVITGLVLVMVSRTLTETRASGLSRDFETAIHATEAASDLVIRELNRDDDYVSHAVDGSMIREPGTDVDEREWTLELLDDMLGDGSNPADTWIAGQNGEAYAVRPVDASDEPVDVIYAAGAVPGFKDDDARIRVIKLQIAKDEFEPNYAVLSDHRVDMNGDAAFVVEGCDYANPTPEACVADVHTNQSFTGESNTKVHGSVSAAGGSCDASAPALDCFGADDGTAEQPIPAFNARDFYRPGEEIGGVGWYDLCPDKKIRAGSTAGPCTGDPVWPTDDNDGTRFRGWRWSSTGQFDGWSGNPIDSGVFYIYRADARINGTDGDDQVSATVILETHPDEDPSGSGALEVGGSPRMQPAMKDDVVIITDRDFSMEGGMGVEDACADRDSAQFSGFIGVGEQVNMAGNAQLHGAMVVQNKENKHKLVDADSNDDGFAGEMCLDFDPNLVVDLDGHWVITYWNEL